MKLCDRILGKLDETSFLGFKIWHFSYKSIFKQYGIIFSWEIVLKHFLKTLRGFTKYRQFLKEGGVRRPLINLFQGPTDEFLRSLLEKEEDLLIAMGFCQKPLKNPSRCPSGRFNHNCHYMDNLEHQTHPACRECGIRIAADQALKAGARMHIMTSAKDIARDILIPSIRARKFTKAIFFLCPYSAHAIIAPLLICGIDALLVTYTHGNCLDFNHFARADKGIKLKQTKVDDGVFKTVLAILNTLSEKKAKGGEPFFSRFTREGNIYVPGCPTLLSKNKKGEAFL